MLRTMDGILRTSGSVNVPTLVQPKDAQKDFRLSICSKPAKNRISAGKSFFVMFAVAMLAPGAWILRQLPEYRQRSRVTQKP